MEVEVLGVGLMGEEVELEVAVAAVEVCTSLPNSLLYSSSSACPAVHCGRGPYVLVHESFSSDILLQ